MDYPENIYEYYEKYFKRQMPIIMVPILLLPTDMIFSLLESTTKIPDKIKTQDDLPLDLPLDLNYFDINYPEDDD